MVLAAAVLVGSSLTAWADAPQQPAVSDGQKARLKDRDRLNQDATALHAQGRTSEAILAAESVLAIERDVLGETSDAAIKTMRRLAQWNEDREDWASARKGRSDVLAIVTQKPRKDPEEVVGAKWALAKVETLSRASDHDRRRLKEATRVDKQARELLNQGKLNEALPLLRHFLAVKKDVLGERASGSVMALLNLGLCLQDLGHPDEALECYRRALPFAQQVCTNSHTLQGLNHEYIAGVLIDKGRHAEARQNLQQALKVYEVVCPKELYPAGHYFLAHTLYRIGSELSGEGKRVEARQILERACAMYERLFPKETNPQGNRDLALCLNDLAAMLANQKYYAEARRYFERALDMYNRLYPKDKYPQGHPELARALGNLGKLLDSTGDPAEARPYLEQALEVWKGPYPAKTDAKRHPEIASILDSLGRVFEDLRSFPEARRYYLRALEMSEAIYPKERYPRGHRDLTVVLVDLGRLCSRTRQFPEATEYYQRALAITGELSPKGHPDLPSIERATPTAVLRTLPEVRWVHFDTHGFFADPEIRSLLESDPDPLDRLGSDSLSPLGRNPLVLSGLALFGASDGPISGAAAPLSDAPRILTAEAIAGLALPRLDLAVLSACETGLGTVAGGAGVFGLQRAFHLAGAQTVAPACGRSRRVQRSS
jgi:tetratricopeptide (TPR) repeat protein